MNRWLEDRASRLLIAALIFAMVAIVFCQHLYTDESWALYYGRQFRASGAYQIFFLTSRPDWVFYKPVVWMTASISKIAGFDHYWAFRLVSLVFALLGLRLVDCVWKRLGVALALRALLVAIIVLWVQRISAGLLSARPEMWYFFGYAYSVYALFRLEEIPIHWFLATAVAFLMFAVHPNGALCFIPLALAAPAASRIVRARLTQRSAAGYAVLVAGAALTSLWTLVHNFDDFESLWNNFLAIAGDSSHRMGIFSEHLRYLALYRESQLVFWTLLAAIAAAVAGSLSSQIEIRRVALAALLTLLAMAVQGAKWTVYFAAPLPALAVVSAWSLQRLFSRARREILAAAALVLTACITFSIFREAALDLQTNTLAQWLLHDQAARRDRAIVSEYVGSETLHALPALFPYVPDADFVDYWDHNFRVTPWRDLARFRIAPEFSSDFEIERRRFLYNGLTYILSENVQPPLQQ